MDCVSLGGLVEEIKVNIEKGWGWPSFNGKLLKPITGTVDTWESAELIIEPQENLIDAVLRDDLQIANGWYSFLVCDMAGAWFVMKSMRNEGLMCKCVTEYLNLKMVAMYRDLKLKCMVKVLTRVDKTITISITAMTSSDKVVAEAVSGFQIIKTKELNEN